MRSNIYVVDIESRLWPFGLFLLAARGVVHEYNNVTILHLVHLAFLSVLTSFFRSGHTGFSIVVRLEIVECTHFGLDETALKVGVNDTSGLWRQGTLHDRPGANLLRSGGVE
jgi:hypothetical protein